MKIFLKDFFGDIIVSVFLILIFSSVLYKIITIDSEFNVEKRLNENYVKVIYSNQLSNNVVMIFNSNYNVNNLFFYKKASYDSILVYENLNLIKELKSNLLKIPSDNINLVFIKNNWYIHKNDLSKKSKEEAIKFCVKLEEIILNSFNKKAENLDSWIKND